MSTLLEKALATDRGRVNKTSTWPLEERLELVLAYVRGRISSKQLTSALGLKAAAGGSMYNFIATTLADAVREELLVRPKSEKEKLA